MAIDISGKLDKLKIEVFDSSKRKGRATDTFTVMFNPSTLNTQHRNVLGRCTGQGSTSKKKLYRHTRSQSLQFELILDGTGVTDIGLNNILGKTKTVAQQVEEFLTLCFHTDGKIHEPKYLRLNWGEGPLKNVDARLESVDIEYTSFERNGSPLRAVLKTKFVEDVDPEKQKAQVRLSSPDLTHARIVRSGDTLPLLAKEIYGSAKYYLQLAKINNLNNFRDLTPGMELIFPPLEK